MMSQHFKELFTRVTYLEDRNKSDGPDRFREREIEALQAALVELSKLFPAQSYDGQVMAEQISERRRARKAMYNG